MPRILLFVFLFFFFQEKTLAKNSSANIQLFITSNLQGWLDSKDFYPQRKESGLNYIFYDILEKKQKNPESLLLDSGDFLFGSPRSFYAMQRNNNAFLKYFSLLSYDVLTIGNRDLENEEGFKDFLNKESKLGKIIISSNFQSNFTQPYHLFFRKGKKILISSLTPVILSKKENWSFLSWQTAIQKIEKIISQEKPDLVIGIFHLSLFFRSLNPSVEEVVTSYPIWDLVIAGQSNSPLPARFQEPLTRIEGIPVVRAVGRGRGWLELNIFFEDKNNKIKKIIPFFHRARKKKKFIIQDGFKNYLEEKTYWQYKQGKGRRKNCLEKTLFQALGEDFSFLPKLRLKPFFLQKKKK